MTAQEMVKLIAQEMQTCADRRMFAPLRFVNGETGEPTTLGYELAETALRRTCHLLEAEILREQSTNGEVGE